MIASPWLEVRYEATVADLEKDIATGAFRRDLFFRLNGFLIAIPPLRERRTEIASLAAGFVTQAAQKMQRSPIPTVSAEALERQVGGQDRARDLSLAFLDALGERYLARAREQRDPAHLAPVQPDRILGAADRAGRQVDRLGPTVVVGVVGRGSVAPNLRRKAARLGGVHHLDVHRAEH